jgi:hypothetical protein
MRAASWGCRRSEGNEAWREYAIFNEGLNAQLKKPGMAMDAGVRTAARHGVILGFPHLRFFGYMGLFTANRASHS